MTKIYHIIEKMKDLQSKILDYVDKDEDMEENFEVLCNFVNEQKICKNEQYFIILLQLLVDISNNHHRTNNFFQKIERILIEYKEEIIHFYNNITIFKIFKSNKRILLFLLNEDIMKIDDLIFYKMNKEKYKRLGYPQYFTPEIKKFRENKIETRAKFSGILKTIPEGFFEKRLQGENDNVICEIIRNDSIEEFNAYFHQDNYSINSKIIFSIYETNPALMNDEINLIEYAAFYGSDQIFKYLYIILNTNWICSFAAHSNNSKLIAYIAQCIAINNKNPSSLFIGAIKCHNNDAAHYIQKNYISKTLSQTLPIGQVLSLCFKYHNFLMLPENIRDEAIFLYLCKNDYQQLVKLCLSEGNIDIENVKILNLF